MYVSFIGLRLTKTSLTLINRTRLRTKGQSAGYPQAQIVKQTISNLNIVCPSCSERSAPGISVLKVANR